MACSYNMSKLTFDLTVPIKAELLSCCQSFLCNQNVNILTKLSLKVNSKENAKIALQMRIVPLDFCCCCSFFNVPI